MTNFEKWKDTILAITDCNDGVAVNAGVPCRCDELSCEECDFPEKQCEKYLYKWLYAEYVEPTIDWSKVPIDTRVLVKDYEDEQWVKGHFAGVVDGKVATFGQGTSWTTMGKLRWKFAKLADDPPEVAE